jgi:hypothetical protein
MPTGSPQGAWRTVGLFILRHQRLVAGGSGALVSGLVALVTHLMPVTGDALPGVHIQGHIAVSPLERFLFGILITVGICVCWPASRTITTLRMMVAVAVTGFVLAAIHRRWDLEANYRFHRDKASDASLAAMNRVAELGGFQQAGTCLLLIDPEVESDPSFRRWDRLYAYHEAQARKYELATSHCWLPVSPDPPLPQ